MTGMTRDDEDDWRCLKMIRDVWDDYRRLGMTGMTSDD